MVKIKNAFRFGLKHQETAGCMMIVRQDRRIIVNFLPAAKRLTYFLCSGK
jgi:hypothetical protein